MNGAQIAQLVIQLGPIAFDFIQDISDVWSKDMTPEEVKAFCLKHRKSYDGYIEAERARRSATKQ